MLLNKIKMPSFIVLKLATYLQHLIRSDNASFKKNKEPINIINEVLVAAMHQYKLCATITELSKVSTYPRSC